MNTKSNGTLTRLDSESISEIRRICLKLTPLAIGALVNNLVSPATSQTEKRKSAELILGYGWGRPVNTTVIEEKAPTHLIIDQQIQDRIEDTFDRIDKYLGKHITENMSEATKTALEPIVEIQAMLEDKSDPLEELLEGMTPENRHELIDD